VKFLLSSNIPRLLKEVYDDRSKWSTLGLEAFQESQTVLSNIAPWNKKIQQAAKVARMADTIVTPQSMLIAPNIVSTTINIRMSAKDRTYYFIVSVGTRIRYHVYPTKLFALSTWMLKIRECGGKRRQWSFGFPLRDPLAKSDIGTIRRIRTDWSKLRLGSTTLTPWTNFHATDVFNFYLPFANALIKKPKFYKTASMWAALASRAGYGVAKMFGKETYSVELNENLGIPWSVIALLLHTVASFSNAHMGEFMPST
jgi:hypothetical protein